jgi:chemotaxis protein MotB
MVRNTGIKYFIKVEGYTDDNPIHSGVFPSNWELSSARAGAILRIFEKLGFEPFRLMAIGFGSSRPAYPNRDSNGKAIAENQSLNRRVVIKVILPEGETEKQIPGAPERVLNADSPGDATAAPAAAPAAPAAE